MTIERQVKQEELKCATSSLEKCHVITMKLLAFQLFGFDHIADHRIDDLDMLPIGIWR